MWLQRQVEIKHSFGTSAYRRRYATVTAQVTLWRVFFATILLAPIALVVVNALYEPYAEDRLGNTRLMVRMYAFEAFPQWASTEHVKSCPQSIDELNVFIGRSDAFDPWGMPLEMKCGISIRGAFVYSAGPDRKFDTDDDITSHSEH